MDYAIITLHNFLPTRATNIIPIYLYLRAEKWLCTPLSPPFLPSTSATSASRTHSLSSFPLSLRRLLSIYREFLATDHSPLETFLFLLIKMIHRFLRELRFLNIVIISACARLPIIKITVSAALSAVAVLFMVAIIVGESVGMTDDIVILSCGLGSSNLGLSPPKTKGIY